MGAQKLYFSPNCPARALTAVREMTPNEAEEKFASGLANWGWLKALKNSARN
jgi:hypothetical protein